MWIVWIMEGFILVQEEHFNTQLVQVVSVGMIEIWVLQQIILKVLLMILGTGIGNLQLII